MLSTNTEKVITGIEAVVLDGLLYIPKEEVPEALALLQTKFAAYDFTNPPSIEKIVDDAVDLGEDIAMLTGNEKAETDTTVIGNVVKGLVGGNFGFFKTIGALLHIKKIVKAQ